jgi:BirA family biotin operon repressor/biotin-[acetyl-CoA-carboxylase] ligase
MKHKTFIEKSLTFFKKLNIDIIKKYYVFDEITSTNDKAKDLVIKDEVDGTVILSKIQRKGKGRFDRIWESPEGGVYLSIILRPKCSPEKAMLLSLMSAIVVSKTISNYNMSPTIKWPNDVQVGGKKIAGVLIESESTKNQLEYVIIGLGINLNIKKENFSDSIIRKTTSLLEENQKTIEYYDFLFELFQNLNTLYKMFLNERHYNIIDEWKKLSDTIGKIVSITSSFEKIKGEVIDITDSGFLIVKTNKNERKIVTSGECIYFE